MIMKTSRASYVEARQQNFWHRLFQHWKRKIKRQHRAQYREWARFTVEPTTSEAVLPAHFSGDGTRDSGPVFRSGENAVATGSIVRCGAIHREPLRERAVVVEVIVND
jgi:hypothetical protein